MLVGASNVDFFVLMVTFDVDVSVLVGSSNIDLIAQMGAL